MAKGKSRAGEYNRRFAWLVCTISQETTVGAEHETYNQTGLLWGAYEPLRANEQLVHLAKESRSDVKIRIRNRPPIVSKDRLQDTETGETFMLDGVLSMKEDNELVITAHRMASDD